jgi:cation:H+ antiporter
MVLISLLLIIAGLAIVVFSADEAIKRLLNLARFFRLSEFVISFVLAGIIAILPELSIGVLAAIEGTSSLGFGVILGANIADLTLVIGVIVLTAGKLHLDPQVAKNVRLSLLAVVLPVLLFVDGEISRIDGVILIVAFTLYVFHLLRTKHDTPAFTGRRPRLRFLVETVIFVVSLVLLLFGGTLVTDNAQALSMSAGLPLFVVGLVVAIGTCLPEMAFAVRSAKKKHAHLGLGNILGNVLADSMLTIGIIALIQPIRPVSTMSPLITGGIMVVSALLVYLLSRDGTLDRKDGIVLIIIYAVFIAVQPLIEAA